jgi:hypothetical protein
VKLKNENDEKAGLIKEPPKTKHDIESEEDILMLFDFMKSGKSINDYDVGCFIHGGSVIKWGNGHERGVKFAFIEACCEDHRDSVLHNMRKAIEKDQ